MLAACGSSDTAAGARTACAPGAAWGPACAGPWGSETAWGGAADPRPGGSLPSAARGPRGIGEVAVVCGAASAGRRRRDRQGAAVPWSVSSWSAGAGPLAGSGTSSAAVGDSASSWCVAAAVLER